MIAEKILDEGWPSNYWVRDVITKHSLAAMQSYADFYYWLGKEGWVKYEDESDLWHESLRVSRAKTTAELYQTYLTNSKPKEQ